MTETQGQKYSKIFIIGPTESLLTRRGNRHPALAQFLVEQDYNLEYVTSNFYHAEKRFFNQEEVARAIKRAPYELKVIKCLGYKNNISLRRIISNTLLSLKIFFYLFPHLNKETVLVLPSRPVEMIFAAASLRITRGTSVMLDIQDIWPDMLVVRNNFKRAGFWIYCGLYLYPSLRFIDKFFHVAPSFVAWLNRYAPQAQSAFIPLGFDEERWKEALPVKKDVGCGIINLVCITQLTFQFNILPLLKAIKTRSNVKLKIIGEDGKGERFSEVINYIDRNGMENVEMVGVVEREEVIKYLKVADIGVVPMVSTSIPNKVFDYIAAYIPLLVLGKNDSTAFIDEHGIGWGVNFDEISIGLFFDRFVYGDIEDKVSKIAMVRSQFSRANLHRKILDLMIQN